MARKNRMYEKMYLQLVRECNEIADSMKVKTIVVPDTLSIDNFKTLAASINSAMEKLTADEMAKLPVEFRKIYPKMADSLAVLENRLAIVERDKADAETFKGIENFEAAVSEMLTKKAALKEAAEQAKNQPENVPETQPENVPENQPENGTGNTPENAGYIDTDMASENAPETTPEQKEAAKQEINSKHGRKKASEIA